MTRARDVANIDGILTTKGDIYAASAAATPARLGVGSNGDTIVADSSTSTGLRWQEQTVRNFVYNSNFDIWQRGTSFANISGYSADRWTNSGVFNAVTISRQTSNPPVGSTYYMRHTATGVAAYCSMYQYFESQDVEQLWGKTVTVSVKLRRNSTVSNTSMTIYLDKSATVDAGSGATWAAFGQVDVPIALIPTGSTSSDWYTASFTATVPSDGTANSIRIFFAYNGGTASGSVYEFSQVMLRLGSVATPYQRQNGTIQGELAACQRYYYRITPSVTNGAFSVGNNYSTTINTSIIYPKVTLRTTPTLETSGTASHYKVNTAATAVTCSSVPVIDQTSTDIIALNATVASGLTVGNAGLLVALSGTTSILAFSAEL